MSNIMTSHCNDSTLKGVIKLHCSNFLTPRLSVGSKLSPWRRSAPLSDIRKLIAHPESIDQARAALAERFGAFTLEPVTQAGKTTYLAHGKVDFFADEAMARTGGAGGQNRTGYARLFRAALYQ